MTGHLRICVNFQEVWIYGSTQSTECHGILCDLLKYLNKSLGFSYNFIAEKQENVVENQNNEWSGVIGQLQRDVN